MLQSKSFLFISIKFQRGKQEPAKVAVRKRKGRKPGYESSSDEDAPSGALTGLRQCYGPGCVNAARDGSTYCGDQCGINLASVRIYTYLPERVREWNSSACAAERKNRADLAVGNT